MTEEQNQLPIDFPAAHSMDSTWFAVDAEGNVASFQTGEAGAMPDQAFMEASFSEGEEVASFLAETDYVINVEDLLVQPDGNVYVQQNWNTREYVQYTVTESRENEYGCLFWLKDDSFFEAELEKLQPKWLAIVQSLPERLQFLRIPHPEAILGFVESIPSTVLMELQREGAFHKCWVHFNFDPTRIGFFGYSHGDMFENWIAGPYIKEFQPKIPIKLEQLPESLQKTIGAIQMENVKFKTDRSIQPFEHTPSGGWQSQCIDSNGVTHEIENLPDAD